MQHWPPSNVRQYVFRSIPNGHCTPPPKGSDCSPTRKDDTTPPWALECPTTVVFTSTANSKRPTLSAANEIQLAGLFINLPLVVDKNGIHNWYSPDEPSTFAIDPPVPSMNNIPSHLAPFVVRSLLEPRLSVSSSSSVGIVMYVPCSTYSNLVELWVWVLALKPTMQLTGRSSRCASRSHPRPGVVVLSVVHASVIVRPLVVSLTVPNGSRGSDKTKQNGIDASSIGWRGTCGRQRARTARKAWIQDYRTGTRYT